MATRFTAYKDGNAVGQVRTTFGDAYADVQRVAGKTAYPVTNVAKNGKADPVKDDPGKAVTTFYTDGFSVRVTR